MENILLAIDGSKLDINTVDFACYIARLTRSRLTAVFMENLIGADKPVLKQVDGACYVETITEKDFPENRERIISCEKNEKVFSEACMNRGVNYQVHVNRRALAKDVIAESRFADMIILSPDASFENDSVPSDFAKDILAAAECPVIISPSTFYGIDEILFAYDGSKSSVFAIKQFAHLFPGLKDKKMTVLQIDKKQILPFREADKIEEWLKSHYANVSFQHLHGKPADELFGYLLGKKNLFVVMGAYGRGLLSNLLRQSTAELTVKTINLPVFIAHN